MSDTPHHAPGLRHLFLEVLRWPEHVVASQSTAKLALEVIDFITPSHDYLRTDTARFFRSNGLYEATDRVEGQIAREREAIDAAREYLLERWAEGNDLPRRHDIRRLMTSAIPEVREFGLQAVKYIADEG